MGLINYKSDERVIDDSGDLKTELFRVSYGENLTLGVGCTRRRLGRHRSKCPLLCQADGSLAKDEAVGQRQASFWSSTRTSPGRPGSTLRGWTLTGWLAPMGSITMKGLALEPNLVSHIHCAIFRRSGHLFCSSS